MKVRSIPAQITSVEDKIAGNLTLTQIILLMIPVFWTMIVYTIIYPQMELSLNKVLLIFLVLLISVILAVRVKGNIIFHWLLIITKFNVRPRYYLFNKNDSYEREIYLPSFEKQRSKVTVKKPVKQVEESQTSSVTVDVLARFEHALANPNTSFSIKTNRKGGLYVSLEQK